MARPHQASRYQEDPWHAPIEAFLFGDSVTSDTPRSPVQIEVTIGQVLRELAVDVRYQTHREHLRVQKVLTHVGYEKYRPRRGGQREYRYRWSGLS